MDENKKKKEKLGTRENGEPKSSPVKNECGELKDDDLARVSGGLLPPKPNPNGQ
ncbi:MAG: hypothetical protein ABFD08_00360 [Syntrophomonas sp.]